MTVTWVSDRDCQNIYAATNFSKVFEYEPSISDRMICASTPDGRMGASYGDSGGKGILYFFMDSIQKYCLFLGPLAWLDPETNEIKLIGVASWGYRKLQMKP